MPRAAAGQDVRGGRQDLLIKLEQDGIEEGRVSQLRCQFFADISHVGVSIQIADAHKQYCGHFFNLLFYMSL